MSIVSGKDKGGQLVWQFDDGTIVPLSISIDNEGNVIGPATEAKQDDLITAAELVRQIDSGNSTTENLGNGGVFEGAWFDALGFISAGVQVLIDQDSATNGFEIQYSTDGSNVHHTHQFTLPANNPNGIHLVFTLTGRYYRIKFTNGTTPQTVFNLFTALSKTDTTHSHTHPIEFAINGTHEAQLVRAIQTGKKPNGDYVNANYTDGGNPKTSIEEYDDAVNPVRKDMEGGGKIGVGTTAVEVTFTGTPTHSVIITADLFNTGILYVGESNVTNAGSNAITFLEAGESLTIDYEDGDNPVYGVASIASQNFFKGALL